MTFSMFRFACELIFVLLLVLSTYNAEREGVQNMTGNKSGMRQNTRCPRIESIPSLSQETGRNDKSPVGYLTQTILYVARFDATPQPVYNRSSASRMSGSSPSLKVNPCFRKRFSIGGLSDKKDAVNSSSFSSRANSIRR